jgi:hypothetical protein
VKPSGPLTFFRLLKSDNAGFPSIHIALNYSTLFTLPG